ncbi:MAG TPA: hypothetical protein VFZ25_03640, partial [Chloroflexota bacterium]|nr:hypothetical protein [Chloroflexota bacterium]
MIRPAGHQDRGRSLFEEIRQTTAFGFGNRAGHLLPRQGDPRCFGGLAFADIVIDLASPRFLRA